MAHCEKARARSWLPCTMKRPARTGGSAFCVSATQSASGTPAIASERAVMPGIFKRGRKRARRQLPVVVACEEPLAGFLERNQRDAFKSGRLAQDRRGLRRLVFGRKTQHRLLRYGHIIYGV